MQVGDVLPGERELAGMLLVSRETVRGAIQRLAGEGIVQELSKGIEHASLFSMLRLRIERIGVTNPTAINGYSLGQVHAARVLVEPHW